MMVFPAHLNDVWVVAKLLFDAVANLFFLLLGTSYCILASFEMACGRDHFRLA